MAFLDDLTLGRYHPGTSLLHRVDPRLKLIMVPLLIIAVFSSRHFLDLLVLTSFTLALMALSAISPTVWWRGLWFFRWFFLFTLVLHLLFTPGHTLFGIEALSRDGLVTGALMLWRLSLAIWLASLLTLTVDAPRLARAGIDLLTPLGRLGVPVERLGAFFLLVLGFLPVLRRELAALAPQAASLSRAAFSRRLTGARDLLSSLLLRLCDQADELARAMALGEPLYAEEQSETPEPLPWSLQLLACLVVVVALWGIRLWL